jgi:hypothetical protein
MILEGQLMSDKSVKVRVLDPFRVVHSGDPYVGGDTASVPEATAAEWERNGWAERVSSSREK